MKITLISINSTTVEVWRGARLRTYPADYRNISRIRKAIYARFDRLRSRYIQNTLSTYHFK